MKGFKSTLTDPYTYTQSGVWKKGQYTYQAVVLSDSGYAFAFQRSDTTWQTMDLSWQVKEGSYSKIQWTFTLEVDAVAFRLIANTVTGETTVLQPMLEKGSNGSTPIAHEEDLRGMDGDNHEFIFTRNTTGIAPDAPLSTQEDDLEPEDWTDNPQGVTKEIPFEFVSMREKKNGVWLDYSPPSLWAKWAEDGLSVNLLVEGHYNSHWGGTTKVVEIVGGVDVGGNEVVKVSAVFRKGEENIAATVSQSRGFQWYVNGVHLTSFDNQPFITLDETYGDGLADYVVLSYLVNSIREEERREIINISDGMDGIGEEFIFKANNSDTEPPVLPQTTDAGYQNDDHHGNWSDDPVAPTESNQFVWVAKRKKVGGIWEAFGTPSLWTWWIMDGDDAAYWELYSSAPLIYKDAEDASTSGVHTTITLSGRYVKGVSSQNGGYISVQPNGGVEDTLLISPREFTPPNNAGVDEYVIRLYDDASKTTLLDTLTVPIAFKGEKGVSAINITLSNESDALPATEDGEVTDYTGSGTTIRVFEGSQELSYGIGNGQYQVSASGSNITPDSIPTTIGNARVYGNASSMGTAAIAVITFTVSGKTFDGESFSFDKVQNFTKSERGDEGEAGEDGITISQNQQGYTYRADLNGNIIGQIGNGMVELTIMSGSTPITCPSSTSGGTPTVNGTYRVTRTHGNEITTNSSISGGKYRITPTTLDVDEATVNLDIKIMMDGVVTSYPLTLTYRKQFDGADGKSTEFIFKGSKYDTTAPTLPSTSQQDDWYGQGTANEWNDDLVEPTKTLPYVWASQRKKVDGVWGAFTPAKVWLRYVEDGDPGDPGDPGEDGYSVSLSKSEHIFNYNKYGNLKGLLSDGVVLVEVMKGPNTLMCDSLGVLSPTVDYTYRVTSITQSPTSSFSYNVDRTNSVFRLIPVDMVAEEVEITFTIVARSNDNNTTFTRKIRYQKHRDGADGTDGVDGDSVVHIYKQYPTKPTTPSSGVLNPTGWSHNPDYILSIVSQTNWTVNGKWHQSEELTATGNSSTSRIAFTTYKNAQTITLELWADGHATYDYLYAGKLDTDVSISNYRSIVVGGREIITYDVPTAGSHYIDIFWRKRIATIVGSNRGYYAIISDVKVWRSTTNVIGGVVQAWSEPQQFDIDTSVEERIYCLSKTTTAPVISDSDAYINDYIPLPCSLSSYRGDFTTNRAYSIGQVVRYQLEYYKVVKTILSSSTRYPTDEEYFEKIPGWTDNPVGANQDYPFEFVAIRRKQIDGLWGDWTASIWTNFSFAENYIMMGWWDSAVTYSKTELGIPLVKKADGTTLGYSVYTLKVDTSTPGTFIFSEWDLVESVDFIYMQQAYIERLQAEIITADRINALDITAKVLRTSIEGARTEIDPSGMRIFNETGQMNIRIGNKNGYAILEYYDNDGRFLYDLGPNGIKEMEVREEKWTVFKRISLGTNMSTILGSSNRHKYKQSWGETETTYYIYTSKITAGINQDPTNDGAIFTSMNKTGSKMPLGFYCRKMPLNGNIIYQDSSRTNQIINSRLPYIQSGNEDVYDRNNICFMDIEHYTNGVRSQTNYFAYWNETP